MWVKKVYKDIKSYLDNFELIDSGLDWLGIYVKELNNEEFLKYFDIMYGGDGNYNSIGFDYGGYHLVYTKSSHGPGYIVQTLVYDEKYGLYRTVDIMRIVKINDSVLTQHGYRYQVVFYGKFFGLWKKKKIDIPKLLTSFGLLSSGGKMVEFNVGRVDVAFTYRADIRLLYDYVKTKEYFDDMVVYEGKTFYYKLYRRSGAIRRLTNRMGIRVYDKSEDVKSKGLGWLYGEYLDTSVRLEVVLGSEVFRGKRFNSIEELIEYSIKKLDGKLKMYNYNEDVIYGLDDKQYKMRVEGWLEGYINRGNALGDLKIFGKRISDMYRYEYSNKYWLSVERYIKENMDSKVFEAWLMIKPILIKFSNLDFK